MLGIQLVCELLPFSAPNIDSGHCGCVHSQGGGGGKLRGFRSHGSPIEGDPAVWTSMTNDSWTDRGLPTSESQACANLSLGDSIRSDIAHTDDGGGLGDNYGEESAHGADGVCGTTAPSPRFTILLRAPRSAVLPPSYWQVRVMMATVSLFRKKALPLVQRDGYEAKSRIIASTTRTCHFDGYTCADTVGSSPFASRRPCCCVLPAPSPRTKISTRPIAQTRLLT